MPASAPACNIFRQDFPAGTCSHEPRRAHALPCWQGTRVLPAYMSWLPMAMCQPACMPLAEVRHYRTYTAARLAWVLIRRTLFPPLALEPLLQTWSGGRQFHDSAWCTWFCFGYCPPHAHILLLGSSHPSSVSGTAPLTRTKDHAPIFVCSTKQAVRLGCWLKSQAAMLF